MEGPLQLPFATAVQASSTAWRLRRRTQAGGAAAQGGVKVYLVRLDGAERLLSHMTEGSVLLRSQTIAKGRMPVFVSYRIRASVHHQRLQTVAAAWKLPKKGGVPQCLLDSQSLALVHALQDAFLPALGAFLRQVASHRHFLDQDLSAICVRLELQYREFLICRSARHQLLVCTLDASKTAVKSLVIRIDCTACRLVCRDSSGSEQAITTLDEALSRLLGRDTSRDVAIKTQRSAREGVNSQRGPHSQPAPIGDHDAAESPAEHVARLRAAAFEEDAADVGLVVGSMLSRLRHGGAAGAEAWLKGGALEPTVHALLHRRVGLAHQEALRAVLELLMEGDHSANREVSQMFAARIEMCKGDDEELCFVLKAFVSLLGVAGFRRACARNDELLYHTCKLHERHSIGHAARLDGTRAPDQTTHDMRHEGKAEPAKHGVSSTHRSILSEFDRCSSTLLTAKRAGELDTGRTGGGDDTARSDYRSEHINSVRTLPSSARALPRLSHAPLPTYSPSKEYSSLSARAQVEDPDGGASPRFSPRSPRAGFLSPLRPSHLDGVGRHSSTDALTASRTPSNIPKLQLMSVSIAESPMQTRSSRRQLTMRGLMSSTRGASTPGPFSPHADSLSRSTTIRDMGGPALTSCRETRGEPESAWGQEEDLLSALPGSYQSAESELESIARSISRSAVAANLAAIAAQRKQTLDMVSARKELSPLPPPKAKTTGRRDDILSLLLDGMVNVFGEPAAGTWLEQHVNVLYMEVFALLKNSDLMAASEFVYHKTMALLCIYQERVETKLLVTRQNQGTSVRGCGSSRRRFDRYAFPEAGTGSTQIAEGPWPSLSSRCLSLSLPFALVVWHWCWCLSSDALGVAQVSVESARAAGRLV